MDVVVVCMNEFTGIVLSKETQNKNGTLVLAGSVSQKQKKNKFSKTIKKKMSKKQGRREGAKK